MLDGNIAHVRHHHQLPWPRLLDDSAVDDLPLRLDSHLGRDPRLIRELVSNHDRDLAFLALESGPEDLRPDIVKLQTDRGAEVSGEIDGNTVGGIPHQTRIAHLEGGQRHFPTGPQGRCQQWLGRFDGVPERLGTSSLLLLQTRLQRLDDFFAAFGVYGEHGAKLPVGLHRRYARYRRAYRHP